MCLDLSGASRIPVTKLFGRSPAGMNATGESDLKNYYDYVDSLRESKLRPILERLLPVILMSTCGGVPEDMEVQFPPLWTPTAKEVSEIAKAKAETIVDVFQAGLIDKATSMRELKKLSDETGLFDGITDEEIAASVGHTFQDVTELRDPLSGIGGEEPNPFEVAVTDRMTLDYPGQPREEDGKFSFGKMLTKEDESSKLQSSTQKVRLPDGTMANLTPGSEITKIHTFAGKGTKTPIREAPRLSAMYGVPESEWSKVRGDGYVDVHGISTHIEIHWYESPQTGRIELKEKRTLK